MNRSRLIGALCAVVFSFISMSSHAVTVTYDGDIITGVTGLEALGSLWNVSFVDGSYNDVYTTPAIPLPFTSSADASTAAGALGASLNLLAAAAVPGDFVGCTSSSLCLIQTPYDTSATHYFSQAVVWVGGGYGGVSGANLGLTSNSFDGTFAVWEVSTVPIPAALWLFGSGLLGLIGVARRKVLV